MSDLKYQKVEPIARGDGEAIIHNGPVKEIPLTLIRLAYFDTDWAWVQDKCISLSSHENVWVRRACVICFGHIARIHGTIDRAKVDPVLHRLRNDPEVASAVEEAYSDFQIFLDA